MALHNATNCLRLLVVHGHRYESFDRYRRGCNIDRGDLYHEFDMRPLAERLIECELGSATWTASRRAA